MDANYRNVDVDKHTKLKALIASRGMTMAGWYRLVVDRELTQPRIPTPMLSLEEMVEADLKLAKEIKSK